MGILLSSGLLFGCLVCLIVLRLIAFMALRDCGFIVLFIVVVAVVLVCRI